MKLSQFLEAAGATVARNLWSSRVLLGIASLVGGTFLVSNLYSSPKGTFLRSANTALQRTTDQTFFERSPEEALRVAVGPFGKRRKYANCIYDRCVVRLFLEFRRDPETTKSDRPSVSVEVYGWFKPIPLMNSSELLPSNYAWQELGWHWKIAYASSDTERRRHFKGAWLESDRIPTLQGATSLQALTEYLGQTIRKEMVAQGIDLRTSQALALEDAAMRSFEDVGPP